MEAALRLASVMADISWAAAQWPTAAYSLLRFAELQDELVSVPANRLVEHFGGAGVLGIGENRTLGVELEPRGFDLSTHRRGLDFSTKCPPSDRQSKYAAEFGRSQGCSSYPKNNNWLHSEVGRAALPAHPTI